MPLPLGHAAFGITVADLLPARTRPISGWTGKELFLIACLANLPDIDVILGLLFHGNGNIFHRGVTHSLFFALVTGFVSARAWKRWPVVPRIGFWPGFMAVLNHIVADFFFTDSGVSFFWPFLVYHPLKQKGWGDVIDELIYNAYRDTFIIAGCLVVYLLVRWLRKPSGDQAHEL